MQTDSPQVWQGLVEAADMQRDNREAIGECRAKAVMTKKATRCTITIQPAPEQQH